MLAWHPFSCFRVIWLTLIYGFQRLQGISVHVGLERTNPLFLFLLMLIYGLHYYLICWPGAALAELFFFRFSFGLLSWPGAH